MSIRQINGRNVPDDQPPDHTAPDFLATEASMLLSATILVLFSCVMAALAALASGA